MEKKCFKCNKFKTLDEFYRHPRTKDLHLGKCKECAKKDVKERYDQHPDKIREYEKKRFKDPKRKKKALKYQATRRKKYRDIVRAYNKTKTDEFKKANPRKPCECCGNLNSQKHHPDYSNMMKVEYLCWKHHLEKHNKKAW